jgi:vancomycin permeability regulator SanA
MATILIFGASVLANGNPSATLRRRVEAALAHARDYPNPRFIPTGGKGRHGPSEASAMARLLMESGVDSNKILLEETGTDTLSSVLAIRRLLAASGIDGPVMVATSAYHLPRCLLLLCIMGISASPCTPHSAPAARDWGRRWYWRLREVPAIPYDAILALWWRFRERRARSTP